MLKIDGPMNQGALQADGTVVPITDTVATMCEDHDGVTKAQATDAYGKLQEHFNRIIQAVANAFPPRSDFALFMGQLQKKQECLTMKELKWRWNYISTHVTSTTASESRHRIR